MKIKLKCRRVSVYLDNGHLTSISQNSTHLKKNPEGITDVVSIELLETLSAISALKNEGIAKGGLSEAFLENPGFTGEYDWGEVFDRLKDRIQLFLIWVFRQLQGLLRFPALQAPLGGWRHRGRGGSGGGGGHNGGLVGGVDGGDGAEFVWEGGESGLVGWFGG